MMNFTFFHRPEAKKFNYTPQFYDPNAIDDEDKKKMDKETAHEYEFANRMHYSWERRRQHKEKKGFSYRTLFWSIFIAVLVCFVIFKFLSFFE